MRTVGGGASLDPVAHDDARSPSRARRPDGAAGSVARDGGVFTFGDAQYYGSTGGLKSESADRRHRGNANGPGLLARRARRGSLHVRRCALTTARPAAFGSTSRSSPWRRCRPETGYWSSSPPTVGFSRSAMRTSTVRPAARRPRRRSPQSRRRPMAAATGSSASRGRCTRSATRTTAGTAPPGALYIGVVPTPGGYRLVDTAGNVLTFGATRADSKIVSSTPLMAAG